jgi:hypothetical protein
MRHQRFAKRDSNQREIERALKACGARVADLSSVGDGFPDLVVFYQGHVLLLEIKDGDKPPSKQKLTPAEVGFHLAWRGAPIYVVTGVDDAVALLNTIV